MTECCHCQGFCIFCLIKHIHSFHIYPHNLIFLFLWDFTFYFSFTTLLTNQQSAIIHQFSLHLFSSSASALWCRHSSNPFTGLLRVNIENSRFIYTYLFALVLCLRQCYSTRGIMFSGGLWVCLPLRLLLTQYVEKCWT